MEAEVTKDECGRLKGEEERKSGAESRKETLSGWGEGGR